MEWESVHSPSTIFEHFRHYSLEPDVQINNIAPSVKENHTLRRDRKWRGRSSKLLYEEHKKDYLWDWERYQDMLSRSNATYPRTGPSNYVKLDDPFEKINRFEKIDKGIQVELFHCNDCRRHIKHGKEIRVSDNESDSESGRVWEECPEATLTSEEVKRREEVLEYEGFIHQTKNLFNLNIYKDCEVWTPFCVEKGPSMVSGKDQGWRGSEEVNGNERSNRHKVDNAEIVSGYDKCEESPQFKSMVNGSSVNGKDQGCSGAEEVDGNERSNHRQIDIGESLSGYDKCEEPPAFKSLQNKSTVNGKDQGRRVAEEIFVCESSTHYHRHDNAKSEERFNDTQIRRERCGEGDWIDVHDLNLNVHSDGAGRREKRIQDKSPDLEDKNCLGIDTLKNYKSLRDITLIIYVIVFVMICLCVAIVMWVSPDRVYAKYLLPILNYLLPSIWKNFDIESTSIFGRCLDYLFSATNTRF